MAWWRRLSPEGKIAFWTLVVAALGLPAAWLALRPSSGGDSGSARDIPTTSVTATTPTTSPTGRQGTTTTAAATARPHYLVDLETTLPEDGFSKTGSVLVAGKEYKKSITVHPCIGTTVTVYLPPGMTRVSGIVGFSDDSSSRPTEESGHRYRATIEATSDEPTDSARWTTIDLLAVPQRGFLSFDEELPPGTKALHLSADQACSTDVAWGNPVVQ